MYGVAQPQLVFNKNFTPVGVEGDVLRGRKQRQQGASRPLIEFPLNEPDTINDVNAPILVIFGCAAVVSVPVTFVNTPLIAPILPTFAFPVDFYH